jgi:hypothetical protein
LAKCAAITQAGTACKGIPIDGSGYCYVHHPDYTDERRRHGSRGGKRGGRGRPVAELATLRAENAEIRQRLLKSGDDQLPPGVATAAIQSINTDIRAVIAALKAREQEDLEARIEALERAQRTERTGGKRWGA